MSANQDLKELKNQYHAASHKSLADTQLRANLKSAMDTLKANRAKLVGARFYDWEQLRERGQQIKQKNLAQLPELLERFEKKATQNGMIIHWAKDGSEANEIIYKLMIEKKIKKILKGKSMASEEIHFNHFLQSKGLEAIETDLGEVIIQLLGEAPVHIVVPAIHKNRYQIGEIFHQKLNAPLESEPEKLNQIARTYMRGEFEGFKMGLSGVNFAIANEGAIWLLENEGNGRMSTTAPQIHVAICGIEKVIESFEDAATLNALLIPSATGAAVTCYNNIISSPRQSGEKDGPSEVHVILLDNNRSAMLKDPHYYEALSCIRCGTCLNHCPVYDKIGGHAYLSAYPGPIGEVISPQIYGMSKCAPMLDLCSLCGRCSEMCPVKIPLANLIRDLRSERVGQGRRNLVADSKVASAGVAGADSRGAGADSGVADSGVGKKARVGIFTEAGQMREFSKLATSPRRWRAALALLGFFAPTLSFLATFCPLPLLRHWLRYRDFPHIDGGLHARISKMPGVRYE